MHPYDGTTNAALESAVRSQPATVAADQTEINVRGKAVRVRSAQIHDRTVICTGTWLKMAAINDEDLVEGEAVGRPVTFIASLRETGLNADIFTFAQKLPDTTPKNTYHLEWDNAAVIPITTYSDWWDRRVESSVRRAVRKATKVGVVTKVTDLDDTLARGIVEINNETPIRQGKAFWHYQKDLESVRLENSTYPGRSTFIGAYYEDELIGFLRIIHVDQTASIVQILSKLSHFEKRPTNALIAKAVELCEQRGYRYLVYCSYIYNDPKSSLTEFKRRNGFEQVLLPRYYVPLTLKGRIALTLRIHRGLAALLPKPLLVQLLKIRSFWYARRLQAANDTP